MMGRGQRQTPAAQAVQLRHSLRRPRRGATAERIGVVVVSHNTREHLRACLASIQHEAPGQVVVVDNASTDGSVEMLRAEHPCITLYGSKTNLGYGAAANMAIAGCATDYVLLLNGDTRPQPGALSAVVRYLDQHPRAAVVGPRLVYPDGRPQPSCVAFPRPVHVLLREGHAGAIIRHLPLLRDRYLPTWRHDRPRVVPWVFGAALAIRREAFEAVGGFDEAYFMYFEETDLCYRLHAAGWEVHFAPVTTVVHVGGASTGRRRAEMADHLHRSLRLFYERHYGRDKMLELKLVLLVTLARNWLRDAFRLLAAAEPLQRARAAEDVAIWRRLFSGYWRWHWTG